MTPTRSATEKLGTPGVEQIKGKMLIAHREWLKTHLSPADPAKADLRPFWSFVPAETREVLQAGILAGSFYDFRHLMNLDEALLHVAKGDRLTVLTQLGEFSAEHNIPKNAVVGSIHSFFEFSTKLHHQFQSYGTSEYRRGGERSGTMIFHGGQSCHSPTFCASSLGFFRGALRLFGHSKAHVNETTCTCQGATSCTFAMDWD